MSPCECGIKPPGFISHGVSWYSHLLTFFTLVTCSAHCKPAYWEVPSFLFLVTHLYLRSNHRIFGTEFQYRNTVSGRLKRVSWGLSGTASRPCRTGPPDSKEWHDCKSRHIKKNIILTCWCIHLSIKYISETISNSSLLWLTAIEGVTPVN